jgi:hypothetical protein
MLQLAEFQLKTAFALAAIGGLRCAHQDGFRCGRHPSAKDVIFGRAELDCQVQSVVQGASPVMASPMSASREALDPKSEYSGMYGICVRPYISWLLHSIGLHSQNVSSGFRVAPVGPAASDSLPGTEDVAVTRPSCLVGADFRNLPEFHMVRPRAHSVSEALNHRVRWQRQHYAPGNPRPILRRRRELELTLLPDFLPAAIIRRRTAPHTRRSTDARQAGPVPRAGITVIGTFSRREPRG